MQFYIKVLRDGVVVDHFDFESAPNQEVTMDDLLTFAHRLVDDELRRRPTAKIEILFGQNGRPQNGYVLAEGGPNQN